ncbi:MAG: Mrp family chromosome partitioning ATPase [Ilumatobacter sp.]|jgi:Mrp family chromosome partitioning ATPase
MSGTRTIDVLNRFWWLIVLFVIAGAVVGGLPQPEAATDTTTARWTASHTILVSSSTDSEFGYTDPRAFNQLTLFTTTGQVPIRAAESLDFAGEPAALAAGIIVSADAQTGAVRISTTQDTAAEAVAVADAFADELVSYLAERQDTLRGNRLASTLERLGILDEQIEEAELQVEQFPDDSVAAAELEALGRQYGAIFQQFDTLQADQSQLLLTTLERAQPVAVETQQGLGAPRSRTTRGLLAGVVGAALGFGLATLLSRTDRKLRTREQVEQVIGLPTHAVIPLVDKKQAAAMAVTPDRHDPLADAYRRLRSIVTFTSVGADGTLAAGATTLVVSAAPADGKSSVSANLIAAFTETGARTIGVNTDFRRPALLKRLGIVASDIVGITLSDMPAAPLNLITTPTETSNLVMVDLSTMRDHSPGQLARATASLVPRLKEESDAIVIDTSPVGATAEVLEFMPVVDNIIVVVKLNHTSIHAAQRTIETVRALSTGNLLLVVIGGRAGESNEYHYHNQHKDTTERTSQFRRKKSRESATEVSVSM